MDPFQPAPRERSSSFRGSPVTDALPPDYNLLDIRVTIGDEIKGLGQDIYPNRNIFPRGLALIMNFEKFNGDIVGRRVGSEKDVIHLDQLLQQLGYKVIIKSDLTWNVTPKIKAKNFFYHFQSYSVLGRNFRRQMTSWNCSRKAKITLKRTLWLWLS